MGTGSETRFTIGAASFRLCDVSLQTVSGIPLMNGNTVELGGILVEEGAHHPLCRREAKNVGQTQDAGTCIQRKKFPFEKGKPSLAGRPCRFRGFVEGHAPAGIDIDG
jgi:hypothetical protein